MKKTLFILVILGLVLYITNPTKTDFVEYAEENYQAIVHADPKPVESITDVVNDMLHTLNNGKVIKVERKNYYLFSFYGLGTPQLGEKKPHTFIGIFKLFIQI